MEKVVQTTLEDEEYKTLRDVLKRKRLSLKEGLHLGVTKLLQDEIKLDPSDPFLSRKAWHIFEKSSDRGYSFTDCTSFALMDAEAIRNAFTFDKHFSQQGYNVVP
jgi:hypothetical protein